MQAYEVKELDGFTGLAKLFHVKPPVKFDTYADGKSRRRQTSFVVASATVVLFSGAETYLFPADKHGNVIDWGELPGSFRGGLDCEQAIREAGYEVVPAP